MNDENTKKLIEAFPELFQRSDDLSSSLMSFGFSCDDGWYNLIETGLQALYAPIRRAKSELEGLTSRISILRASGQPEELEKRKSYLLDRQEQNRHRISRYESAIASGNYAGVVMASDPEEFAKKCLAEALDKGKDLDKELSEEGLKEWVAKCFEEAKELESQIPLLTQKLQEAKDNSPYLTQVKEKFGGLRIYTSGATHEMQIVLDVLESLSEKTCEVCGSPGHARGPGWIRTLCDLHAQGR